MYQNIREREAADQLIIKIYYNTINLFLKSRIADEICPTATESSIQNRLRKTDFSKQAEKS